MASKKEREREKRRIADIMARVEEIRKKHKGKVESVKTAALQKAQDIKPKAKSKVKPKKPSTEQNGITQNRLELLITIVNRPKGEYYADLIQSFDVNLQCVLLGSGTADMTLLSRFGLTDSDRAVIFSVIQESKLPDALAALDDKFKTIKNGKGIAYTIPMTSVIGTLIFGFLSNNKMAVKDK